MLPGLGGQVGISDHGRDLLVVSSGRLSAQLLQRLNCFGEAGKMDAGEFDDDD
jgi:hypothetical protein